MPYNGQTGIGQLAKIWSPICNTQGSWAKDQTSHSYPQRCPPLLWILYSQSKPFMMSECDSQP
ncbi:MAG: hypothetical protein DM484_10615 [Candidatus Methylumidiphilus alinenensis]|uniref:Uncharacterized protein n=1 Tax=Candidatus Methylumidiphilus alinenensis TaxID=2202197 RepID=A0A2W4R9F0_9GAMM|nr:MAG: hypothetical protein DM484_10615 [Candidatus Methylumidiphilus alinenensis]